MDAVFRTYHFPALQSSQIRLLKLHEESNNHCGDIHGSLEVFDLAASPPYMVLSYVWGEMTPSHPIYLDNHRVPVGHNLYCFLQLYGDLVLSTSRVVEFILRFPLHAKTASTWPANTYIWIDQLCIDQSNLDERSEQICLMRHIYSQATQAIIWLGPSDDKVVGAMEAMKSQSVEEMIEDFHHWQRYEPKVQLARDFCTSNYWSRSWIVQEFVLAKDSTVMCGEAYLGLQQLELWFSLMPRFPNAHFKLRLKAEELIKARERHRNGQFHSVANIMTLFIGNQCTDPKDTIYGFLGLLTEETQQALAPDYKKTPEKIFDDVMASVVSDEVRNTYLEHGNVTPWIRTAEVWESLRKKLGVKGSLDGIPAEDLSKAQEDYISPLWKAEEQRWADQRAKNADPQS